MCQQAVSLCAIRTWGSYGQWKAIFHNLLAISKYLQNAFAIFICSGEYSSSGRAARPLHFAILLR
jgi:hypothetical protein